MGTFYLPVGGRMRGFLALGLPYVVTSSFTLATCVRDAHEAGTIVRGVDQAASTNLVTSADV